MTAVSERETADVPTDEIFDVAGGPPPSGHSHAVAINVQPTLAELSRPGRGSTKVPHPPHNALDRLPAGQLRRTPLALPELAEPEVIRHFVNLSQLNYAVDTGFYPLGSCTMKYNPKINEWAARLPGFAALHPLAPDTLAQGTLELLWDLEQWLLEISGMAAASLQPAAGAQGELTGILMIRAYHAARGDDTRTEVIVPDSSHGTNPATASMAGFRTVTVKSDESGQVDLAALRAALGPQTAAVMLTNPSTLGLFETRIVELLDAVHAAGALAYMDGANMNAILGKFRPGAAGFDVMHFNTHKTFSTPHGGGGPGAGPVAAGEQLAPFLPAPRVVREDGASGPVFRLELAGERPQSIGRVRSYAGSIGVLVRAYAYLLAHGGAGLTQVSEDAVLSANYLRHRLSGDLRDALRAGLQTRVRGQCAAPQGGDRRAHARCGQAADRLRLPSADHLLPADGRRGHARRTHGNRVDRDTRRLRRRAGRDRDRGARRSRAAARRPALDACAQAR